MKIIVAFSIISLGIVGCVSDPNGRDTEKTIVSSGAVGESISCIKPPPDVWTTGLEAELDASIYKLGQIANANITTGQKIEKIRGILPEVHSFEVMEYRFCRMYTNGLIDKATYNELVRRTLPTKNTELSSDITPSTSQASPPKVQLPIAKNEYSVFKTQEFVFSADECNVSYSDAGFPRGAIVCDVLIKNTSDSAKELTVGRGPNGSSHFIDDQGNQESAYTKKPGYTSSISQKVRFISGVPQKVIFVARKENLTGAFVTLSIEVLGIEKTVVLRNIPLH